MSVKINDEEFAELLWERVEAVYPEFLYQVSECYYWGKFGEQNYAEAFKWASLAANQRHWKAIWRIGDMYYEGKGVKKDVETAQHCYMEAMVIAELGLRTEVFISYAHTDAKYRDELRQHLIASEVEWWDDTLIQPGDDWDQSITDAIARARIVVLLVSMEFITSEYIQHKELPQIMAAEVEGAKILWLPLESCEHEAIAKFQAFTDPKKPLAKCNEAERDEVFAALVKRIKEAYRPLP